VKFGKCVADTKEPALEEQVTIDFAFTTVCTIADIKKGEKLSEDIWLNVLETGNFS
jgi:N-acetylneuraminate synthase